MNYMIASENVKNMVVYDQINIYIQHQGHIQTFANLNGIQKLVNHHFNMNKYYRPSKKSIDLTSCCSTEEESSQDEINCQKTNPLKHKTELCKNFSELGYCNYGSKCRFAHGSHEIIRLPVGQSFRKKRCNNFWITGCCLYGTRCMFGHELLEWQTSACLMGLESTTQGKVQGKQSRLLHRLS